LGPRIRDASFDFALRSDRQARVVSRPEC